MLEWFKLAGAFVAFVIALFTLGDRWTRGRPLAWVTAKKYGASRYQYIRIQNPGPADLFIRKVRTSPPIYSIARNHSAEEIVEATVDIDAHVLLAAGETHDLVLIPRTPRKHPPVPGVSRSTSIGVRPARVGCGRSP
jgi:hypothetical protein